MEDIRSAFVQRLVSYADVSDRRALAALRRGLGKPPGAAIEMMPFIVPFLPAAERDHWAYFVVGTLFGLHPSNAPGVGFGTLYRRLADNESGEKRFLALLDAHIDDLPGHLRRAISIARQKGLGLDYGKLLGDILYWSHPDHSVQRQWARQFWSRASDDNTTNRKPNDKE